MVRPQGFPKGLRLSGRKEIGRVFREGRYHRLGWIQAKTLPNGTGRSRFLISVRKSVANAPGRNRIKRVLREAIRLNRQLLRRPYDVCFFITRRPTDRVQLSTVEKDVRKLFDRLSQNGGT